MSAARAHAVRFYSCVALAILAVTALLVVRGGPRREVSVRDAGAPPDTAAIVRWCADGLDAIAGGGCFAAPKTSPAAALLVYLHGRYAPEAVADELERQARVARMGTARGYAVLALRGMQGQCTDPTLATWWCWPSNERNAEEGAAIVARWSAALSESERRIGKGRRVLLGFSNGGYFSALIASRALAPFDAVTIAHAGPVQPMRPVGPRPPVLLIDADDDPSSPEIAHLDADLTRESWPHAMVIREGGHALPEWDVEMALTFFDRVRTEKLPLVPPLAPPRAPHPHDTGDAGTDPEAPENPRTVPTPTSLPAADAPATPTPTAPLPADPVLDAEP